MPPPPTQTDHMGWFRAAAAEKPAVQLDGPQQARPRHILRPLRQLLALLLALRHLWVEWACEWGHARSRGSRAVMQGHVGSRGVMQGHAGSRGVKVGSQRVTWGHAESHKVTRGHAGSRAGTAMPLVCIVWCLQYVQSPPYTPMMHSAQYVRPVLGFHLFLGTGLGFG